MHEQDSQQPTPQPPVENFLPARDALLDPTVLSLVVTNPLALYDEVQAKAAEQSVSLNDEDVSRGLDEVRRTAIEEVLLPEAKAQLATGARDKMVEVIENIVPGVTRRLDELSESDDSARGARSLRMLEESLPEAQTAVRHLIKAQEERRLDEGAEVQRVVYRLRNFGEIYQTARRGLAVSSENKRSLMAGARGILEDGDIELQRYLRFFNEGDKELDAHPAAAVEETVVAAVQQRGEATIAAHQGSAHNDHRQAGEQIDHMTTEFKVAETMLNSLFGDVREGATAVEHFPRANRITDAVEEIRARLGASPRGQAGVAEDIQALRHALDSIEEALHAEKRRQKRELEARDAARQSLYRLDSAARGEA